MRTTFDNVRKQIVISAQGTLSMCEAAPTAATSTGRVTAPRAIRDALALRPFLPAELNCYLAERGITGDNQRKAIIEAWIRVGRQR